MKINLSTIVRPLPNQATPHCMYAFRLGGAATVCFVPCLMGQLFSWGLREK